MSTSKLFQSTQVGNLTLRHRIVHAPLTRLRANHAHDPSPLAEEYYAQRASEPGTLIIAEAALIAPRAGGYKNVPGIYSDQQIAGWRKIVDAIHAKGSFVFLQLGTLGRSADLDALAEEGPYPYIAPSPVLLTGKAEVPRPLTIPEIKEYVQLYVTAASNAVHRAGFDGVEVHGANGYLVDQFLQDVSNHRTDEYGGSAENRVRFALDIVDAIAKAVGEKKTAIRISPWSRFQDMLMKDPIPTFSQLVIRLRERHSDLAYLHVIEPRIDGIDTREGPIPEGESNDFIRELWAPRPLISAGAYTRALGMKVADQKGDLIAYGRSFLANPDLPYRLKENIPLAKGDRKKYYVNGSLDPSGYTDYPFADRTEIPSTFLESRL